MPNTDDLYEILQVHHAAEPEVIESAYWRLARKYHPDVNKSDQATGMMVALNRAYEVLGDPVKRAVYDLQRSSRGRNTAKEPTGQSRTQNESKRDNDVSNIPHRERVIQLFGAARSGDTNKVRAIIASGVDVNARYEGSTPLHMATTEGHLQTAQALVRAGARIDVRDFNGYTPLYIAAEAGNLRAVRMLAGQGADTNAKDKNGSTPLHIAAFDGNTKVVRELIRLGADVNLIDKGYTPLDIASVGGYDSTVSALLAAGAATKEERERLKAFDRRFNRRWRIS